MSGWSFGPGIFSLTGQQLSAPHSSHGAPAGRSPRRGHSKKRATLRSHQLKQRRKLESAVLDDWVVPEPVLETEVEEEIFSTNEVAPATASSQKEEKEEEDLNDEAALDWRRDPEKPPMRMMMSSNVTARARWQIAFAKVRELTASARKRQHRVALGMKVKEYLMFHHLRGTCSRMTRSVDSFERSIFSDKTDKMEITYEAFSDGVVPEADEWVRKNFEDMREALEPVVSNEQFRKYDMNELERMLRMKEQEDSWLDAQQKQTEELLHTHGKLMERSVSSLADMVRQVRQVLSSLAAEIAGGLQKHRSLKAEYEQAEHESFDMSQKQKKLMTQIEEFEARQKEAKDKYNREVEILTQEFTKVRRATTSVKFQLAKDEHYCDRLLQQIQEAMSAQMMQFAKVMAEEHIKRIQRKWDVRQREKIMRQATYEKELRELRQKVAQRKAELEERRSFLEVSVCRSKAAQAKLLLFELRARTQELEKAAPVQRKKLKRLFSTNNLNAERPQQGLLFLLGEELQLQKQWLTERGQDVELDARSFQIQGKLLVSTPTSLISHLWPQILEVQDPSRAKLTRVFRDELSETRSASQAPQELQQLSASLFDSTSVQQAVDKALNSLEATRQSQRSLAERWQEIWQSVESGEVHEALTEKLEELDQGLNVAEASTRWLREPDQNTAQHLAAWTSKEELLWLRNLSTSLSSRCGQLRASTTVLEASEGEESKLQAVGKLLGNMPTLLDEDTMKFGAHFAQRTKKLLAKREKLQDEMLESWSRRMSVHQEETIAESVSEGLGSLLYLLDDDELKETPQEEITPAELLNILHCTAARVFKHRKSQVFDWAMMGLGDMDQMVSQAVLSEQAARAQDDPETPPDVVQEEIQEDIQEDVQEDVQAVHLAEHSGQLLPKDPMEELLRQMQMEAPNDLLQSMEDLAAVLEPTSQLVDPGRASAASAGSSSSLKSPRRNSQEVLAELAEEAENSAAATLPASRPGTSGPATSGVPGTQAANELIAEAIVDLEPTQRPTAETDVTPSRPSSQPSSSPAARPASGPPRQREAAQGCDTTIDPASPAVATDRLMTDQHVSRPSTGQNGQPAIQIGLNETANMPEHPDSPAESRPATGQHPAGREITPPGTEVVAPIGGERQPGPAVSPLEAEATGDPRVQLETLQATNGPEGLKDEVPKNLGETEESPGRPVETETEVLADDRRTRTASSASSAQRPASGTVAPASPQSPRSPSGPALPSSVEALEQTPESAELHPSSPRSPSAPLGGNAAGSLVTEAPSVASPGLRPDSGASLPTADAQEVPEAADAEQQTHQSAVASPTLPAAHQVSEEDLAMLHEDALQMLLQRETSPTGTRLPPDSNLPIQNHKDLQGPATASPKSRTEVTAEATEESRQPEHPATADKKDNVGPTVRPEAEEEENMDDLAALVSANFSRRLAENSGPGEPAGPVVTADFSNVIKKAQHVQAMQSIRADLGSSASLGLSPKSATTSPKAKAKRRRRPRAMTRLGKELDEEEEDPGEVDDASPVDETASAEGDDFRMKLEAILAKAVQAKADTDRAKEAKELAAQINQTQVGEVNDVVQPEVLELQRALKSELETELKQVSQQIQEAADGKDKKVSQDLQRRATALQEQLMVVRSISSLRGADGDHVFMMALKEMTGGEEAAVAFAHKALSRQNSETTSPGASRVTSPRGPGNLYTVGGPSVVDMRFPRQNSPVSSQSPESPPSPRSPRSPQSPSAAQRMTEDGQEEVLEEQEAQEDTTRSGQQLWKRGKFIMKFLAGLKTMVQPETTPQPSESFTENQEAKVASAAMKLRKPEAWGRAAPINEEDHQDMSLAGIATGPKKELQPGSPRDRPSGPLLPVRRLSQEVIDPGSIVAVGQSLEPNVSEEEVDDDEEYFENPGPAWVDSWLQSAEGTFLNAPRHDGHHQELVAPSIPSSEQPTVSILSLQAEGSSQGPGHRGLKGFAPRRGAPRFVRDKAKKGSHGSKPEDYGFIDFNKPKSVSIQEEPEVREDEPVESQLDRSDAVVTEDQAPADSDPLDEVPEPPNNEDVQVADVTADELRRDSRDDVSASSGPEAEESEAQPVTELRREDSGSSLLSRNVSKTARGKMYRESSKGKGSKMDLLIRSRSFRSSTSLNLSEPGDDDDRNLDDLEAETEEVQDSEEEKRQMAVRRWKLGTLAVQAVVRLRETIHSPPVPGSRRNSFNPPATMVADTKPAADVANFTPLPVVATPATGITDGGQPSVATPLPATPRTSKVKETMPKRQAAPSKLPQVPVSQAAGKDVSALRRTSLTPRTNPPPAPGAGGVTARASFGVTARASVLQVNVPDSNVLTPRGPAQRSTAPTPTMPSAAITPRLPPAPAPPKTAVRQNGVGDMTAKSSLDRGNNLILTAATIQAVRSLDAPYLGGFGKSEQRLLSAHTQSTQLSHDDSHLTLSKDSAYSSAGFSPYTSQTELHKMSATNLSYQSSLAKFSTGSREEEEPKEEHVEATEVEKHLQLPAGALAALPLLDRKSFGVETALLTPTGKLLGSPGCWNPGLSKEVGEIHVAHAGHVLEMRSLPVLTGKVKGLRPKAKAKGPKLVLNNLVKPKKKRQLVEATSPAAGAAREEPRRQPLYTKGVHLER